jgi:triacylglycerol lipase
MVIATVLVAALLALVLQGLVVWLAGRPAGELGPREAPPEPAPAALPPAPEPEPERPIVVVCEAAPRASVDPDSRALATLRARPPRRRPEPERVAFLHGFAGFAEVGVGPVSSAYFRGVAERLRERGVRAAFIRVSPFASIGTRAAELAAAVRALGAGRTHLVAHSMGGLDARFAVTHLGLDEHVASLVTIATPHGGTPLADAGARLVRGSRVLSESLASVLDLTTERMRAFEADTPDMCTVQYASIAVSPGRGSRGVGPWLLPTYRWLRREAGDNDGVVPLASQRRGRVLGHLDADHWSAVGWGRFDAPSFYERLVLELLAGRGLAERQAANDERRLLAGGSAEVA